MAGVYDFTIVVFVVLGYSLVLKVVVAMSWIGTHLPTTGFPVRHKSNSSHLDTVGVTTDRRFGLMFLSLVPVELYQLTKPIGFEGVLDDCSF